MHCVRFVIEVLADELGTHNLAVDRNKRSVRLVRKRKLRDASHHERVSQAADDGKQREHAKCARCDTFEHTNLRLHHANAEQGQQHVDNLDEYERRHDTAQTPHQQVVGQQLAG